MKAATSSKLYQIATISWTSMHSTHGVSLLNSAELHRKLDLLMDSSWLPHRLSAPSERLV